MTPIEQFYMLIILPALQEAARMHGYALAFHGSATRDLDLVAAPWMETASPASTLIEALADAVGANLDVEDLRPHGRRVWKLSFLAESLSGPYIDVSVMPRSQDGKPTDPV